MCVAGNTYPSNSSQSDGEITEVSDDGILRDDEGNPISSNEAEENMLRDDEGNIIDPKTLVIRDFLLDLSCESDEYYDDEGEKIDPKELISVIGEFGVGAVLVTDSSTRSEGEGDCAEDVRVLTLPLHDETMEEATEDADKEPSSSSSVCPPSPTRDHLDVETYEDLETRGKRNQSSRRRRRRDRRSQSSNTSDEYLHIMFNNQLTTLREESGSSHDTDSGDEADDESPRNGGRVRRASHRSFDEPKSSGSFDEKFIKVRWEYSLQMMTCGSLKNSDCMMQVSFCF